MYICPKCKRPHSEDEFRESRFCINCGKFLFSSNKRVSPESITPGDNKKNIAEFVVKWYKNYIKENPEQEITFLSEIDASTSDGKIEIILLGRLFSQYRLKEEDALEIWRKVKTWFLEENYSYREIFEKKNAPGLLKLENKLLRIGFPGDPKKFVNQIKLAIRRLESPNGEIELKKKDRWKEAVESLAGSLRGTGIKQKAFWIFRVLKQIGEWEDIPGEYCCVSDKHVKSFLKKLSFVKRPDEDLFYNSRVIWNYFNEPFEERYYDLPVFRFARVHKCAQCKIASCNLDNLMKCAKNRVY
jgi:hypothetical protein